MTTEVDLARHVAGRIVVVTTEELAALLESAVRRALDSLEGRSAALEWLDAAAAAELLRVHPRTIGKLVRQQGLPAHRIGKLYRFERRELLAWIEKHRAPTPKHLREFRAVR
ncbi:helix-turn-helix domain-containing protein [Sandaracinus amylolyticus]|uniref:helix-turn-helix domain-containing protein n=1 Tax=Sandaracinus amylolyticus TaxID=927083 RepID=UPI0012ECDC8B|nr:helix-turn-helix domain-containing protein [Sandaracinus amylolyticus]